jgi:dUTP pyrophosphatase
MSLIRYNQPMRKIKIKRFDKTLPLPEFDEADPKTQQQYDKSQVAGFDLFCREDVTIAPHELALVGVNNAIATPPDCFLLLAARSSTPWKKGLMLANGIGIVDPFYSGDSDELKIQLYNFTDKPIEVKKGETLAQGVIVRREAIEWQEVETMGGDGHGGYKT